MQNQSKPAAHIALRALQKQAETQYLARKALELELILRREAQPVAFVRPATAVLPLRLLGLLGRIVPRLGLAQAVGMLRRSGLVDADWYRARYPDVARAGADPVRHYLTWGAREERDPGPHFCTGCYLRMYPDVAASGINPLMHYLRTGWGEKRRVHPAPAKPVPHKPVPARAAAR